MKLIGTRLKKVDFSNDLSVGVDFRLNPQIQFNFAKLNGENLPKDKSFYAVSCNVTIEGTKENRSPIRVNIIAESRYEFDSNETEDEIQNFIKNQGIAVVYDFAKSILAATSLIAGIAPIALPDLDKLSQGQAQ